uniref:Uncharacterized protein n=1 Tax=Panagrellus redivivus TaxID=6233 RepID=A0A7E4ZWG9_PANRE
MIKKMNHRRIVAPIHGRSVLVSPKRPLFTMPPIQPRILPSAPSPASTCQCPTSRRLRVDRLASTLKLKLRSTGRESSSRSLRRRLQSSVVAMLLNQPDALLRALPEVAVIISQAKYGLFDDCETIQYDILH